MGTCYDQESYAGRFGCLLAVSGAAIAHNHGAGHGPGHGDPMGDKTVTRAEAQTHAAAMFARMDVNKDGKIDAGDREARQITDCP